MVILEYPLLIFLFYFLFFPSIPLGFSEKQLALGEFCQLEGAVTSVSRLASLLPGDSFSTGEGHLLWFLSLVASKFEAILNAESPDGLKKIEKL